MNEHKVVISQEESLTSLLMHEILCSMPELRIAIIGDNVKELREAFKIYVPNFEYFCDQKHLAIIDLIAAFGFGYGL
jgi:hypothetical protein